MKRSQLASLLVFLVLIPATLFLGLKLPGRGYYLTSTLVVIEIMIPFFLVFEGRKPQARELVVLAVMAAIAIASRVIVPLPNFKPIFAIVMLTGIAFGPEAGFLVGAVSALVSNFFFGQGPFTPWQMMAYGAGGLLAGFVFTKKWLEKTPLSMAFFGFMAMVLWVGPLLDVCSLFLSLTQITTAGVLMVFGSGAIMNIANGICTALTMLLFGKPLLEKLDRIKVKYGMLS